MFLTWLAVVWYEVICQKVHEEYSNILTEEEKLIFENKKFKIEKWKILI